jgi:hypothetical protein
MRSSKNYSGKRKAYSTECIVILTDDHKKDDRVQSLSRVIVICSGVRSPLGLPRVWLCIGMPPDQLLSSCEVRSGVVSLSANQKPP